MINKTFNLIDDPWISVVDVGRVSLKEIFRNAQLKALGGSPIQKIAVTKLLLAIAQSAYTPEDDQQWHHLGSEELSKKCLEYLNQWHDHFYLYGDKPFLQMPEISKAQVKPFGSVLPEISTGNTTVLTQIQKEKPLDDADKAILVVQLMGMSLGGKQIDNSIVLTPGYQGKSKAGKSGSSIGFKGFLHNFIQGKNLQETLWFNLFTMSDISKMKTFESGLGTAPWEKMPEGEDDEVARGLKNSLIGRLIPLNRFVLLKNDGIHYSEGIQHLNYADGMNDPSVCINYKPKKPVALWVDTEKRPWRMLTSLLSFISSESTDGFECMQLKFCLTRSKSSTDMLVLWSGGLKVSSQAGEQYASGDDDFVESLIELPTNELNSIWFANLKDEISSLEQISKSLYASVMTYYKILTTDGKSQANKSTRLFWHMCASWYESLINRCASGQDDERVQLRKIYASYVDKTFNICCPSETARQFDAWAQSRPNLSKYLSLINKKSS